jgi:hypothetical protein
MTQTPRHMRPRECTALIKRRVVQAATDLMTRTGCEVTTTKTKFGLRLDVTIPADSADPHGARLQKAIEASK